MSLDPQRNDISRQCTEKEIEMYRRMTAEQRVRLSMRLTETWRNRIVAGVRRRHPNYTEQQMRMAVLYLMHGKELFQKVYPGQEIEP